MSKKSPKTTRPPTGLLLLRAAQQAAEDSGLTRDEIARELDIPHSRVTEFLDAEQVRGLLRLEQFLEAYAPGVIKAARKYTH